MPRKYSRGSQKKVEKVMNEFKRGQLKSGRSGKKVTNPRQAVAIGLSEARQSGEHVPAKKTSYRHPVSTHPCHPEASSEGSRRLPSPPGRCLATH